MPRKKVTKHYPCPFCDEVYADDRKRFEEALNAP